MNEAILTGLIAAAASIIVAAISNNSTKKMIEYKIDELTKRVDKHNNTIERTYDLERRMSVEEEKQKVANNRIADLEREYEKVSDNKVCAGS